MYSSLSEELREILSNHSQWLELMNKNPRPVLTEKQMSLRADLGNMSLRDLDLYGIDLSYASAINTDFSGSRLTNGNLKGLYAPDARFEDCTIISATFRNFYGKGSSFYLSNLSKCDFSHSFIANANFDQTDLADVKFHGCHMDGATMTHAPIKGADFRFFNIGKDDLVAIEIMRMAQ